MADMANMADGISDVSLVEFIPKKINYLHDYE